MELEEDIEIIIMGRNKNQEQTTNNRGILWPRREKERRNHKKNIQ